MCGITGTIGFQFQGNLKDIAYRMVDALNHRGPDANDIWLDEHLKVFLGHNRLSILDLSSAGAQPLISHCQRYVLAFNGEIYNHLSMRADLEKEYGLINWRGHSDTETIANAFSIWGVEKTLKLTRGMFALALWDRESHQLFLARDRMGEKPLYYGWISGNFVFASELKSFHLFPTFERKINQEALNQFLLYSAVPTPLSIYENIYKLEPGSYLKINLKKVIDKKNYWSLKDLVNPHQEEIITDEKKAISTLKETLRDAVKMQMTADVPLGAFLSGGVDSSTIVALMQEQSAQKIQTFTIGFEQKKYDESYYADRVSKHLGTQHHCEVMTDQHLLEVIPKLPKIYDEPFADSSQIPTFLVSQVAKSKVTVALSGDAGDELFGGYTRYIQSQAIWKKLSVLPYGLRKVLGHTLFNHSEIISKLIGIKHFGINKDLFNQRCQKLGKNLELVKTIDELYHYFLVNGYHFNAFDVQRYFRPFQEEIVQNLSEQQRMMYYDSMHYLPNDILTKVDRASMAVSLETRVPMLDPNVIKLAWCISEKLKFKQGQGKWVLKKVLSEYLPEELIYRSKMGFGVPLGSWLNTSLKDWSEDLLSERSLNEHGLLNVNEIRDLWQQYLLGKSSHVSALWNVLMFQAWYREYN